MVEWSQDAKLKYGVPEFKSSRLITFFFFFFLLLLVAPSLTPRPHL